MFPSRYVCRREVCLDEKAVEEDESIRENVLLIRKRIMWTMLYAELREAQSWILSPQRRNWRFISLGRTSTYIAERRGTKMTDWKEGICSTRRPRDGRRRTALFVAKGTVFDALKCFGDAKICPTHCHISEVALPTRTLGNLECLRV